MDKFNWSTLTLPQAIVLAVLVLAVAYVLGRDK